MFLLPLSPFPDSNECSINNGGCEQNCSNTEGSFACNCKSGYTLNADDRRTCQDLDECSLSGTNCQHKCTNTEGSFMCECDAGLVLNDDGKTCSGEDFSCLIIEDFAVG